jgi:peptidoglycan/xylan/chitin deacetylase (PgdA/CDA1 family)
VARATRAQPTSTPGALVDTSEAAGAAAAADRSAPTVAPTPKTAHVTGATATSATHAPGAQPTPTPGALVDTSEAAGAAAAADRTAPTAAATASVGHTPTPVTNASRTGSGQASTSGATDDASEAAGAAAAADRTAPTAVPTRYAGHAATTATSEQHSAGGQQAPPASAEVDTFQAASVAAASSAGVVALTFDAGADRGYAEDILDLLRDQHVLGTFGVTGKWAKANPDLVQRMADEHHLVINHTYDHRSFTGVSDDLGGLSPDQRRTELESADQIIAPLIGHSTRPWYRLPYGDDDAHASSDVAPTGFTQKVGWTVDSLGWKHLAAPDIVTRCLERAAPGAVYIFHVGGDSQDHLALERIIPALRERGFGFTTIDRG